MSPSTTSFELYAKTAEEIDLEKCNFRKFGRSVTLTLTLDGIEVTLVRICGRGLPTHQIRSKSEELFVDVHTDGRTHLSSNLLRVAVQVYYSKSYESLISQIHNTHKHNKMQCKNALKCNKKVLVQQ